MSNAELYLDFLAEHPAKTDAMNTEWVLEMLQSLVRADKAGARISPEWIRASHAVLFPGDPLPPRCIFFDPV